MAPPWFISYSPTTNSVSKYKVPFFWPYLSFCWFNAQREQQMILSGFDPLHCMVCLTSFRSDCRRPRHKDDMCAIVWFVKSGDDFKSLQMNSSFIHSAHLSLDLWLKPEVILISTKLCKFWLFDSTNSATFDALCAQKRSAHTKWARPGIIQSDAMMKIKINEMPTDGKSTLQHHYILCVAAQSSEQMKESKVGNWKWAANITKRNE